MIKRIRYTHKKFKASIKSNHGFVLKKFYKVIKFKQNAWLKPYIDINIDLRKKSKNYFEKRKKTYGKRKKT